MTTTPNELRAAAMAVEIHYAEQPKHVWFTDHDDNALKLARHYLSILHPDADEPISEEWLLSIGFQVNKFDTTLLYLPSQGVEVQYWCDQSEDKGVYIVDEDGRPCIALPSIKTACAAGGPGCCEVTRKERYVESLQTLVR